MTIAKNRLSEQESSTLSKVAWVAYCVSLVAVALASESVPFAGMSGMFAGGGRPAMRVLALCVPLALSAVLWAVEMGQGTSRIRATRASWVLGGLFVISLVSTVLAIDPRVAFFGYWINEQGLVVWLAYFALAFLGSQLITTRRRLVQLTSSIVGAAAGVAFFALCEVGGLRPFPAYGESVGWMFERGSSTMFNPDFLGTYLVLPAVVSIALACHLIGWRRWLAAAASVVIWLSLLYSLTRGALIGAVVGAAVLVVVRSVALRRPKGGSGAEKDKRATTGVKAGASARDSSDAPAWKRFAAVFAAGGAVVIAVLALGYRTIQARLAQTIAEVSAPGYDLSGRLSLWREYAPAIAKRPLFGAGADHLLYAWQPYADRYSIAKLGPVAYVDSAHNFYIDVAVQFGIPFGIGFVLLVVWLGWVVGRRVIGGVSSGTMSGWLELGWIAALAGTGVAYLTAITIPPIVAYTFAGIGVLMALDARGSRDLAPPSAWSLAALAAIVGLTIGTVGVLSGASAIFGNQSAASAEVRATKDLSALKIAPWRQYPAYDLLTALQNLTPEEQRSINMTVADGHRRILATDSHSATRLYDFGDYAFMTEKDPATALRYADMSLAERPNFAGGLMLKGDALNAMNRPEEARPYFERAVEVEARGPEDRAWYAPWASLINFLATQGKTNPVDAQAARDALERFKQRFPGNPATQQLESAVSGQ